MGRKKGAAERSKFSTASSSTFGNSGSIGIFTGFGHDVIDANVDPRLKVSLRKISKKDYVTKTKACGELLELISEDNGDRHELIGPLLNAWPRYYQKLASENEPRVRTQAHQVTVNLILLAQKQAAPHLRNIMRCKSETKSKPSLLYGTCDEYGICSSTASAGLNKIFVSDDNKIKNLVCHVRSELAEFLTELIQQKPEKNDIQAELNNIRTTSQALRCLAKYYHYTAEKIAKNDNNSEFVQPKLLNLDSLFESKSFWKLSRAKDSPVRAGFFELSRSVLKYTSPNEMSSMENWSKSILSSLGEADPICLKPLWASILLILSLAKNKNSKIFDYVNFLKAFVPGLWSVLRGGGFGCGSIIFPHILPLMANVPQSLATDPFYPNFFGNLEAGLVEIDSKLELKYGLNALFECYQFAHTNHLVDVVDRLSKLVDTCLENPKTSKIRILELGPPLSSLLNTWKTNDVKAFDQFWSFLFDKFGCFAQRMLNVDEVNPENFDKIDNCAKLVEVMHRTLRMSKRSKSVCFRTNDTRVENSSTSEIDIHIEDDMIDLVIELIKPFETCGEPIFSLTQLLTISTVIKHGKSSWLDLIFLKIGQKLVKADLTIADDIKSFLLEEWMLPKLKISINADSTPLFLPKKTKFIDTKPECDETGEQDIHEPEIHDFRMQRTEGGPKAFTVLSKTSDIILFLANNDSKNCAKILSISDSPSALVPLLPFLLKNISDDISCGALIGNFYQNCSFEEDAAVIQSLLRLGPTDIKDKILHDLVIKVKNCDSISELEDLLKLRYSREDKSNLCLAEIGVTWSKLLISDDYGLEIDASASIIDILNDEKAMLVYEELMKNLLFHFIKQCSNRSFAKTVEIGTVLIKKHSELPLVNLMNSLGAAMIDSCSPVDLNYINALLGLVPITESPHVLPENFSRLLLLILIMKTIGPEKLDVSLLSSCMAYTVNMNRYAKYFDLDKSDWAGVEIGSEFPTETFGFVCFELVTTLGHKIENQSDQVDYDILISELLSELEQPIHSKYFEITKSEEPSLLIGALEQLRILGVTSDFGASSPEAKQTSFTRLFEESVKVAPDELNSEQWDFILCNMVEWLDNLTEYLPDRKFNHVELTLMNGLFRLLSTVSNFLLSPNASVDPSLPPDLIQTWKEFFLPQICKNIFSLYISFEYRNE